MGEARGYRAIVATPLGRIGVRMNADAVTALDFLPAATAEQAPADAATEAVVTQLQSYFRDSRSPGTGLKPLQVALLE